MILVYSQRGVSGIRTIISYFAIYVIWGSTYLAIGMALETLPMFFISSMRFLTAGTILLLFCFWRRCERPTAANWLVALKSGVLSFVVSFGLLTWAQQTLPSAIAALIVALEPVWFVLFSWLFFNGSKPNPKTILALAIGISGCSILVFSEPTTASAAAAPQSLYMLSAFAVFVCGFTWVYGSLLAKSPDSHKDSTMASGMQMFSGGVVLFAVSLFAGDYSNLSQASVKSVGALLYLIAFGSLYAYSAYVFLLKTQPTERVAAHTFINPIVAVLLGWAFAGEKITSGVLVAGVLVLIAVVMIIYGDAGKGSAA